MSQTAVREELRVAVAGMIADSTLGNDIISRAAEEALGIPFGFAVMEGTNVETQCSIPATTGVAFLGVAAKDQKEQQFAPTLGVNLYDDEETVGILRRGRIWVTIFEDVVAGDPVRFWVQAGAVAIPGEWGTTLEANDSSQITVGAAFVKGGTAAGTGIALLQLDPSFTIVDD